MRYAAWDELVGFGMRLLATKGVSQTNARYVAEIAVTTEAFGINTHGVALFSYLDETLGTQVDAAAEPILIGEKGATALIDGQHGIGQLAVKLATELGASKARTYGVAMVAARNVSWLGALGIYLMPLAEQGFLAQLCGQTSHRSDCAPCGGIDGKLGTNPVAFAFPTGEDPMVADFALGSVSMGKVAEMIRMGQVSKVPIFLDKDGNLTGDPHAPRQGGTILFLGGAEQGHKGYSLGLWCEALAAVAGGPCGCHGTEQKTTERTFNLVVSEPAAFAGTKDYERQIGRLVTHVKSSRVRPGFDRIRLPGERGYQCLREARTRGISLPDHLRKKLQAIARRNNIPLHV